MSTGSSMAAAATAALSIGVAHGLSSMTSSQMVILSELELLPVMFCAGEMVSVDLSRHPNRKRGSIRNNPISICNRSAILGHMSYSNKWL